MWSPRLVVLVLVVGCSDEPSATTIAVGACDGKLTVERDTSAEHVEDGSVISWSNNPPSSGAHYQSWAAWDRQYPELPRGNYVHNAEHGGVILLYHCDPECPEVVDALLAVARGMPADSMCTAPITKRVIVTSDPLLPAGIQVAAVAWNHAYTATCYDDYVATFASEHYAMAPENFCSNGVNLGGTLIGP